MAQDKATKAAPGFETCRYQEIFASIFASIFI
jgi:hypothetical protein